MLPHRGMEMFHFTQHVFLSFSQAVFPVTATTESNKKVGYNDFLDILKKDSPKTLQQ